MNNLLRAQTAGEPTATKIAAGDLSYKRTETLIGDSYLPALRNFSTTMR